MLVLLLYAEGASKTFFFQIDNNMQHSSKKLKHVNFHAVDAVDIALFITSYFLSTKSADKIFSSNLQKIKTKN